MPPTHAGKVLAVGERFGKLTVSELLPERRRRYRVYLCRCDCGRETAVRVDLLKSGKTRSCGCIRVQHLLVATSTRRGGKQYRHPLFRTWCEIRYRCHNPNHKNYPRYGGRGIYVDPAWMSFAQFVADMGERPGPGWHLHRVDPDGPYSAGNCVWLDPTTHHQLHTSQLGRGERGRFLATYRPRSAR